MIYFELEDLVPSKKNSRILDTRRGYVRNLPSHKYQRWHSQARDELLLQGINKLIPGQPLYGAMLFTLPDLRRRDLTNMAQSIEDLLVDMKVLNDDAWAYWQIGGFLAVHKKYVTNTKVWIGTDLTEVQKELAKAYALCYSVT